MFWKLKDTSQIIKTCGNAEKRIFRVATNLENLEKSGNFEIVRENLKKAGKNVKESGILNFAQTQFFERLKFVKAMLIK